MDATPDLRMRPASGEVKLYHLRYSLEALERSAEALNPETYRRLRELLEYRLTGRAFEASPVGETVAVAFSGGVDSTAALRVMKAAGFGVSPIMARLPQLDDDTVRRGREEGAVMVEVPGYEEAMEDLIGKRAPVCGRCHSMVMKAVEERARELGTGVLVTGDMLSFGLISIYEKDGLVILNLPAFLALDKGELIEIAGVGYRPIFGCPLLWRAFRSAPGIKKFSIERILRELRAGALTPDIASKLIEDVLSR